MPEQTFIDPGNNRLTYRGESTKVFVTNWKNWGLEHQEKFVEKLRECARVEEAGSYAHGQNLSTILSAGWNEGMRLGDDFAPLSFTFELNGISGGIIFHGQHDNGGDGGAPTFSVNLTRTTGWLMHT